MKLYIGFDDTDNHDADRGTGKLARWFEDALPAGCIMSGVVRQQLLIDKNIPYTSHNSSACVIADIPDRIFVDVIIERAIEHVKKYSLEGSDPGVCVASAADESMDRLIAFGLSCTSQVVTQRDALRTASRVHLSGHGGTNDGIIGAAAAVGLTVAGWYGRFIEHGGLRDFPEIVSVSELNEAGMLIVSIDRDAMVPAPSDIVNTKGWLRPRLWGNRAVLFVVPQSQGVWESLGGKRNKNKKAAAV
ncbi:MAG: hypothetical protein JXC33_14190 [Deltaproteobacteria bacterium]|nr:hypothetical protein [Deltaproteobacteria bacterium]